MSTVFADSYYFLALINEQDEGHARAIDFSKSFQGHWVTTEWVLTEVGDALAQPHRRPRLIQLLQRVQNNPRATVVEASHELFMRGIELFSNRPDKEWSLTDCTSFVVIEEQVITEALTADHHFQQAGFVALLT